MISHKFLFAIVMAAIFIAVVAFFVIFFAKGSIEKVGEVFFNFIESFKDLFRAATP